MKFKNICQKRGLSVEEAANELGISRALAYRIASGGLCGKKTALKVTKWSDGQITLEELLYPSNNAA